jgi:hypothetical protein
MLAIRRRHASKEMPEMEEAMKVAVCTFIIIFWGSTFVNWRWGVLVVSDENEPIYIWKDWWVQKAGFQSPPRPKTVSGGRKMEASKISEKHTKLKNTPKIRWI